MHDTVTLEPVHIPTWAWLVTILAALGVYLMSLDNGAILGNLAGRAHEFFHDGRHFLSVPCH